MSEYETEFPKRDNQFLKASAFQDCDIPLTFVGWKKKGNEDRKDKDGSVTPWKSLIKYQLRYSYPEMAIDTDTGEKKLGTDGKPFQNQNWDARFPKGYSIVYAFEEGVLESGSLPLFNALCMVRPAKGDIITIRREGKDKETKWFVKKGGQASAKERVINIDDEVPQSEWGSLEPDPELPAELR